MFIHVIFKKMLWTSCLGFFGIVTAQLPIASLDSVMANHPKNIVIQVDSNHCIYCLIQDKKIQKSPELKKLFSTNVYYVALKYEDSSPIKFGGKVFYGTVGFMEKNMPQAKNGSIGFPLWLVYDHRYHYLTAYEGLLSKKQLTDLLVLLKS